jgi:predicted amidohydrolase
MFTTGFSMAASELAEAHDDSPTLEWMREQAAKLDAAITGSVIISDEGRYFNRLYWVEPAGRVLHYDKKYRFTLAGEHRHYAAGSERLLVDYRGWRICPLICYDLRFPEWSRNDPADPFDLLIYVASWPRPRAHDWRTLLAARAIENQCYVAGVNRVGEDGNGLSYRGDSCLIDPGPAGVVATVAEVASVVTASIDRERLLALRRLLPFLQDQ